MPVTLIADSGATKCEWRLVADGKIKSFVTQGISPYFLSAEQISALLTKELLPKIKKITITDIHFSRKQKKKYKPIYLLLPGPYVAEKKASPVTSEPAPSVAIMMVRK